MYNNKYIHCAGTNEMNAAFKLDNLHQKPHILQFSIKNNFSINYKRTILKFNPGFYALILSEVMMSSFCTQTW